MEENKIVSIPLNRIVANRYQPRLVFDDDEINALSDSIIKNGLIQPITVRQCDNGYEIIAGERRFRACQKAGLEYIDAYVISVDELKSATMALVENIQRVDLSAIEQAKAYLALMRQADLTQAQVAQQVAKSQSAVANKIRLLNLPVNIQESINNGTISERHGRALLSLKDDQQQKAFQHIVDKNLTVAQSEQYIDNIKNKKSKPKGKVKAFNKNQIIAINTIKQSIEMVKKSGFAIDYDLKDNDDNIQIVITMKK